MSGKVKRCYNCDSGNKSDKESLEVCKDCGLPFQRKNWKPLAERLSVPTAEEKLKKATELLKKVIKVTWGEGWNYSLDVKVEAEQFLKECEK